MNGEVPRNAALARFCDITIELAHTLSLDDSGYEKADQVNYNLSHQAIPQGARDGSATVNYLHQFYTTARRTQTPSPIETCQFFAEIDVRSIILWLAEGPNLVPAAFAEVLEAEHMA
ncbi:hypothetical protein DM02DRAFT_734177 [Periconia macrospinosa]|uniref:Uncharacterized protein n=1 Tax=Periconia macrospinosa TaxID=97972 RepID=A0A2V1D091_9PLEO|nr:hypothetical protein DM02DRAFT_734177 [Periconia macrospinosa]